MEITSKRSLMIANGWVQAAGIVLIVGFLIMGKQQNCGCSSQAASSSSSLSSGSLV
jgi:hypothetical protein